jgi:hypothetical protein
MADKRRENVEKLIGHSHHIVWDSDDSGMAHDKQKGNGSRCYTAFGARETWIYTALRETVNRPDHWLQRRVPYIRPPAFVWAPEVPRAFDLYRGLSEHVPALIDALCSDDPSSDFAFLAKQRNTWKEECPMCAKTENIGTTCTCGHTEIVMLRPCGHILCARPCFAEWAEFKSEKLQPKTLTTSDGQRFRVDGVHEVNLTIDAKACPVCRTSVSSSFAVEDVRIKDVKNRIGELLIKM